MKSNNKTDIRVQLLFSDVFFQAGASKKRVRFHNSDPQKARGDFSRKVEEKTIRYTASKLYQKGVLISIEGLPQTHLQNVLVG